MTIGTAENPAVGDVDLDGQINVTDLIYLQRYLLGTETMNEAQRKVMDANADGVINGFDLAIFKAKMLAARGEAADPVEPTETTAPVETTPLIETTNC